MVLLLTFWLQVKCSLLILLCTLTRLFEETLLQPLWIDFTLHPRPTLWNSMFIGRDNRTRIKAQFQSYWYDPQPSHTHGIASPPHLPHITHQYKWHNELHQFTSPCADGGVFRFIWWPTKRSRRRPRNGGSGTLPYPFWIQGRVHTSIRYNVCYIYW